MQLRTTPIKIKLTVLLMISSSLAVLLVSLLVYFWLGRHYQEVYQRDLNSLAGIIGNNCTAALLFNVPEDAETVLHSLESRASVVAIRLYDQDQQQFASYEKAQARGKGGAAAINGGIDEGSYLRVEHAITLKDGTEIGSLVFWDDVRGIAIHQATGGGYPGRIGPCGPGGIIVGGGFSPAADLRAFVLLDPYRSAVGRR